MRANDQVQRGRYSGSPASSGANLLVAGVTGKKIVVTSFIIQSNGTVNAKFQDGSTDITGLFYEVANTGVSAPNNDDGWFETSAGNALNLNLSGATAVGVTLNYILVG